MMLSDDQIKTEFRNLKLKVVSGEYKFTLRKDIIKKLSDELDFVQKQLPDEIISGSLSLRLFGLLSRESNDIDIVISDKNKYSGYKVGGYGDDESNIINRLGYIDFWYKKGFFSKKKLYQVDFFEDSNATFEEMYYGDYTILTGKKLKVHNPLEVINHKINIVTSGNFDSSVRSKHRKDLSDTFKILNMQEYVDDILFG